MRLYRSLNVLRNGNVLVLENGIKVRTIPGELQTGDLYIGERNLGPQLLTVKELDPRGWVVPVENAYFYNTWECEKVEVIPE